MKLKNLKKQADRKAAIEWLVDKDFDYITYSDGGGLELLRSILDSGFKGYGNYTDRELNDAIVERKEMERMFG
jgi:hypothetical protein